MSRSFAIAVLLVAPPATTVRADDAAERAARFYQRIGARVVRDEGVAGRPVVELDLSYARATDDDLEHLSGLPHLQVLNLSYSTVTGTGLRHAAGLKHLRDLDLSHTKLRDADLKPLAGVLELRRLHLGATLVSDAGLRHLVELDHLAELDLSKTLVTGPAWSIWAG